MRLRFRSTLLLCCLIGLPRVLHTAPAAEKLAELRGVAQADFNHDGSRLIVLTRGGQIGLWDVDAGTPVQGDLGPQTSCTGYVMSADGRLVLVGSDDGVRVFDTTTAAAVSPMLDPRLRANLPKPAVFSPDDAAVIIFEENTASVWNTRSGARFATMPLPPGPHDDAPPTAAFAASGNYCFLMDPDGTVTRYETKSWKPAGKPMSHPRLDFAYEFDFMTRDDGRFIATTDSAGENGPKSQLQVWDATTSKPLGAPLATVNGFTVRFVPGADRILIRPARGPASVRELPSMKVAYTIAAHDELDGPTIEISPDGKWILAWGTDRKLDVINAKTGKIAGNIANTAPVSKVLFAPDSAECFVVFDNTAFFLQNYHDGYIMKMSLPELKITASWRTQEYSPRVSISADGQGLLIVQGKTDQERLDFITSAALKPVAAAPE